MKGAAKVAGVILAAGKGSRMGQTKQLLPFRGQTILECVIDSALASSLHRVVVVLGHEAERLLPLVEAKGVEAVVNPRFREGQSSSLKAGLGVLTGETDAVLFLLGDQPLITPRVIDRIIAGYQSTGMPIVLPVYRERRGNPVLFSRETFQAMEGLKDDCGARPLLQQYVGRLLPVRIEDPAIHFDIDTQEQYRRLLEES